MSLSTAGKKIVILQFGDYGEAFKRLRNGGAETYRDQRFSVGYVASLAPEYDVVTIAACDRPHDEQLERGLRSIGEIA